MRYSFVFQTSLHKNGGELIHESPNQKKIKMGPKMKLCDRKCMIPEFKAKFQFSA